MPPGPPESPSDSRKLPKSLEPGSESPVRGRLGRDPSSAEGTEPAVGVGSGAGEPGEGVEGTPTNAEAARSSVPPGADSDPRTPLRSVSGSGDGLPGDRLPGESAGDSSGEITRVDPDLPDFRRARAGDERAFERLIARHQDRVFTRIFFMVRDRETAADLTQEAFLRTWRGLASFREESLFTTWLAKVALNVTRHHFERQRAQKRTRREFSIDAPGKDDQGGYEIADRTHLPEEWALRNERQKAILAAIATLEPEFREALSLRDLHGYSYQEIGETLDLPIGTVKSKIFRARQALQEKLKDLL